MMKGYIEEGPSPLFFVSADSKGLSVSVSRLFSTLTKSSISVDSKWFTSHQIVHYRELLVCAIDRDRLPKVLPDAQKRKSGSQAAAPQFFLKKY